MHFCNLIRWYDFLQHTLPAAAAAAVPSKVSVLKPKFAAPAAPAASAAPAAAKAESKPASAAPAGKPATAAAAPAAAAPVAAGKKDAAAAVAAKLADGKAAKPAAAAGEQAAAKGGEKEGTRDKAAGSEGKKGADAAAAKKEGGGGGGSKEDDEVRVDMLDLRVGRIVKIDKHPNADSLYLEEIDLGEDKPRQVISGLVKYVPVEAMRDRLVVVACNLKPAKMRDVMSYGMVMCASSDDHEKVDPIAVPPGAKPGDKVNAQGYDNAPLQEINPKVSSPFQVAFNFHLSASSLRECLPVSTHFGLLLGFATSLLPEQREYMQVAEGALAAAAADADARLP